MAVTNELQNQWEAYLKLVQVREPKLFQHLKPARVKELTKYNLILLAQTADDLKEMEVGLKVYHDKITEFTTMVFGDNLGIKTELSSESDWKKAAPATPPAPVVTVSTDQNELLKVLEASIRQKVEAEIRAALQAQGVGEEAKAQISQKIKEELDQEEANRRLAVRMALVTEGEKTLTQLVMAWQQAKQSGEGGPPWGEVRQKLLELLDATVQLTHS